MLSQDWINSSKLLMNRSVFADGGYARKSIFAFNFNLKCFNVRCINGAMVEKKINRYLYIRNRGADCSSMFIINSEQVKRVICFKMYQIS